MELSDYVGYDALALAELVRRGEVTAAEVKATALRAIAQFNPSLNAVVEVWPDAPSAQAGPLHGVPFLVKDLGLTIAGRRSELGSRLAAGFVAPHSSGLAQRFQAAGLVALGRTATPELGLGTTTESLVNGPTRNPWNPAFSPGGSSGGAGAAVAAGMVPLAHATDGGGSIRVPAAANDLFGLKPSRGRVAMGLPLDALSSSLVASGVLSRSVRDSAALLDVMQGGATAEWEYLPRPAGTYLAATRREPGPLAIGLLVDSPDGTPTSAPVARATRAVARQLLDLGHRVEEVVVDLGLSWTSYVELNAYLLAASTAGWLQALAAATNRPIDASTLEPPALALYTLGRELKALDLLGALNQQQRVSQQVAHFFSRFDLLLTPTLPTLPPALAAPAAAQSAHLSGLEWVARLFQQSPFTALANVTGLPAMSVPLSVDTATGLPIGSHFMTGWGREELLFQVAGQLERTLPWASRRPVLPTGENSRY